MELYRMADKLDKEVKYMEYGGHSINSYQRAREFLTYWAGKKSPDIKELSEEILKKELKGIIRKVKELEAN